jgi:O-antigen/teichoic acid export membrane protein
VRGHAKRLTKSVAIYGVGDAVINVVNFVLLGVYVQFDILTKADYGALALILSVETLAKVISRWGLDGAFMRFYHERDAGVPRRRLTSTMVWFLVATNAILLGAALLASNWIAAVLDIRPGDLLALRLMFVNIALMAFTFVPLHAMRLEERAATYSAFVFARSAGTVVLRIAFVIGLRLGVPGMYLSDLILTLVLLACMWPWFRPLLGLDFSKDELKVALRFALPRVPAGLASQVLDSTPRILLQKSFTQDVVGVFQNGATLGTGVAFFKSAFETAWAPFYYETARRPDAKETFSKMATYGIAVFVLLVAGTTAVAHDVILLVLRPDYLGALPVVPLIAVSIALQGVYQLTSIGLNLTKRTEFYSLSTISAAVIGIAAGWYLIPRYGLAGAAVTVLISYLSQAAIAWTLAQSLYPVAYETGRLVRIGFAGTVAALAALWLTPAWPAWLSLLAHGSITVVVYGALLWSTGFFRRTEIVLLREVVTRLRQQIPGATTQEPS